MIDLPGRAIADFHFNTSPSKLWVYDEHGPRVEMPVITYFRNEDNLTDLEQIALSECRGKTMDIGAGAGSHALILQEKGLEVTALEISPLNVSVMEDRGVKSALLQDIYTIEEGNYDTLLLMMNGIGLAGNIDGLRILLQHLKKLILPGGQILFDSSDVAYLYEDGLPTEGPYYGEIRCYYAYKRQKTPWFTWLYIDQQLMNKIAIEEGWEMSVLFVDNDDQYLARLTLADN